ncbi:MAG: hypothetical protein ABEK36_02365 [Candidatus Aenigmatarchaeota archaeon]
MVKLECDICGKEITPENIGFAKNAEDGESKFLCNECHNPEKNTKQTSYRLLD